MRVRPLVSLLAPAAWALSLVLLAAANASAQLVPGWNTKQFTLERIDADRIRLTREVEIEGEKGSPNEGQKFFADEAELNTRTGELTASGNVVFSTPDTRVAADSVVFNTHTKLGTFTNASGIAALGARGEKDRSMFGTMEPDIYFYGQVIEKIDVDKYRITKGAFTTCVQPTPRWEIASGSSIVNLHDYALLNNAIIRVKDVPVFYLPIMHYPIQDDDRATGFLIPTYGRSTYRGQSISNAFFWAISRSQDATFFHDWFLSRAARAPARSIATSSRRSRRAISGSIGSPRTRTPRTACPIPTAPPTRCRPMSPRPCPAGLRGRAPGRLLLRHHSAAALQQQPVSADLQHAVVRRRRLGRVEGAQPLGPVPSGPRVSTIRTSSFVSGQAPGVTASYTVAAGSASCRSMRR